MRTLSRTARTTIAALACLIVTTLFAQRLFSSSDVADEETARLVTQMIPQYHLSRAPVDDGVSSRMFDGFLKQMDSQKLYFLQSDIDEFSTQKTSLDDMLKKGNVTFAYHVFDVFRERATSQIELAHKLIDMDQDFSVDESLISNGKDREWAQSQAELNDRWRKTVKLQLLEARLDETPIEEARENLHKRYRNLQLIRVDQWDEVDTLELYLTELAQAYDPHSSYMSPNTWEDFEISLSLHLDGIGAALRADDGYTVVAEIVAGGAADMDGRLKVGDKITGVGQATGDVVDIFEMKLSEVVRLIRGERGTLVRLQVKPADGGETQIYDLTRAKIELKAQEVKGEIIDAQTRLGRQGRVGIVEIPSFYRDFEGAQEGNKDFTSAAVDVAKVLREFNQQDVDIVVVDLRNNGGGALSEAIEISGHFIDQGPVVQVKDERGRVRALDDEIPGVLWSGPLVVICNRASASASEIFAGVIKDYHRGIVIGDTTTHGKGTVQNLMDVAPNQMFRLFNQSERGKLKLTIQQFYRVNGDSTQNRGVRSDIVLPSLLDHGDLGESFLDNALPFDHIQPAEYSPNRWVTKELTASLQQASEQRIANSEDFQKLQKVIAEFVERKSQKTVTLNETQAREEREKADEINESFEDMGLEGDKAEVDGEAPKKDDSAFPDNYYNDEALQITLDYLDGLRGRLAAAGGQ